MTADASDLTFSTRVGTSLDRAEEAQWSGLTSLSKVGRLYSSPEWARMVSISDGEAPTFFRLYRGDQLVAGLTADLLPPGIPAQYDIEGMLVGNFIVTGLQPWAPPAPLMPCMTVVTRAGRAADFRVHPSLGTEERTDSIRRLLEVVDRFGTEQGSRATALLFTPHEVEEIARAAESNFTGASISSSFFLDITFESLEDYFGGFASRKRAVLKKEYKRFNEDSRVSLQVLPLADCLDTAARLGALNFAKYGQVDLANVHALRARNETIVDVLGDSARALELTFEGEVMASLQFNTHDDIYYARLVGIQPTVPRELAPYFNMGFYALIKLAVAENAKRIVYAQELSVAKLSRGCSVEVQDLWIRSEMPEVADRLKAVGMVADISRSIKD